ncbi:MAG TPA: L,D-transpeptidase [Ignavibacteriales bacterium]|nr:L,D-transpeptidase [Ignavibacteriales bacterium]
MKALKLKSRRLLRVLSGVLLLAAAASNFNCADNSGHTESASGRPAVSGSEDLHKPVTAENPALKDTVLKYKLPRQIRYSAFAVKGRSPMAKLDSTYGTDGARLILALNRLDEADIRRADTLIVPDTLTNLLSYCPYPYVIEKAREVPKLLLISRRIQAFAAYENGVLVKWGPTSTGRKAKPTPEGLFSANWKSRKTTSTIDSSWILPYYFNFQNKEGVALHQFSMPGYPASHACVRLLENDARWLYYWAEQWILSNAGKIEAYGTPIVVFDDYRFGKRKPWKNLLENPDAITVSDKDIQDLMDKYLPTILERSEKRKEVLAAREAEKMEKTEMMEKTEKIPDSEKVQVSEQN